MCKRVYLYVFVVLGIEIRPSTPRQTPSLSCPSIAPPDREFAILEDDTIKLEKLEKFIRLAELVL